MKPRTLLVLFLVVAALAAFVWFIERDLPGSDERAELADRVLPAAADAVALEWDVDGESLRMERAGEASWRLVSPVSARADSEAVQGLVDTLGALEARRTLDEVDLAAVGLEPPVLALQVEADGAAVTVQFGAEVPAADQRFAAASPDGPYWIVDGDVVEQLSRGVDEWRSRDLWSGKPGDVQQIVLDEGAQRLVFARRDGDFQLVEPLEDRADPGTLNRFLERLDTLEVSEFVDAALPEHGFDSGGGAVELTDGDGGTWRLELGVGVAPTAGDAQAESAQPPSVWAQAEDQVYRLDDDPLTAALARPIDEWRSLELVTVESFAVVSLAVEDSRGAFTLERRDGDWFRDADPIGYEPASELLFAIAGARAESLDATVRSEDVPRLALVLTTGDAEERLELFAGAADRHPARVTGRTVGLGVAGATVRDIESRVAAVRNAPVEAPGTPESESSPDQSEPAVEPPSELEPAG